MYICIILIDNKVKNLQGYKERFHIRDTISLQEVEQHGFNECYGTCTYINDCCREGNIVFVSSIAGYNSPPVHTICTIFYLIYLFQIDLQL